MNSRILARLALLLVLVAPLAASEQIKLKSGKVVKGRATSYDAEKKVLHFRTDDGKDMDYPLDQLDQRSVYLVHAGVIDKGNGKGQLQLANFARDAGLWEHAARRYGYAEQADPALKPEVERERAKGRGMAADFCLKSAKSALAKNDAKEAEKWLTILLERLPNEPQAVEASSLLDQHYAKGRNARDDELEKKHAALLQKDLKEGKMHYDRMIERTQQGLTARNTTKSASLWEGAIDDGKAVLKEIEKLEKKYPDDPKVQEGAVKYRELTIDQMVDAYLHLASQSLVKSSYKEAEKYTNAALALDPKNTAALSQRARIEEAANEGVLSWM